MAALAGLICAVPASFAAEPDGWVQVESRWVADPAAAPPGTRLLRLSILPAAPLEEAELVLTAPESVAVDLLGPSGIAARPSESVAAGGQTLVRTPLDLSRRRAVSLEFLVAEETERTAVATFRAVSYTHLRAHET